MRRALALSLALALGLAPNAFAANGVTIRDPVTNMAATVDGTGALKTSGGGGGGGAVTIADGADVTLGSKADAANCATTFTLLACIRQLHTDLNSSIPAGSNVIGGVTIANGADIVLGNNTDAANCASGTSLIACSRQLHVDATSPIPTGSNVIGVTGVAQGSTTSGQNGDLQQCAVLTANPAYTTGQTSPCSNTITGALRVGIFPGTVETASSANVANAAAVATLAASAGHVTYISGFTCSASGATAGLAVTLTVAGVITGTMNYTFIFPAGVAVAATPVSRDFATPIPASAANTTIVVTLPAGGSGNTNATCNAQGFQL